MLEEQKKKGGEGVLMVFGKKYSKCYFREHLCESFLEAALFHLVFFFQIMLLKHKRVYVLMRIIKIYKVAEGEPIIIIK